MPKVLHINYFFRFFLSIVFLFSAVFMQEKFTISGIVKAQKSSELMIGATVSVLELPASIQSNSSGFYSLTLPEGTYTLQVSFLEMEPETITINLDANKVQNFSLTEARVFIKEVEITSTTQVFSKSEDMSTMQFSLTTLEKMPTFLGQKDLIKMVQLSPGVVTPKEGLTGYSVRGGGVDQNLTILDEAIIYNPQHFGGLFSSFYGSMIKSAELMKGAFPARYGGRISSVLNVNTKDGNKENYEGEISFNSLIISGYAEGPMQISKSSFFISARRSILDLFLRPLTALQDDGYSGGFFFHDLSFKMHFLLSEKDQLFVSNYYGQDDVSYQGSKSSWKEASYLRWYNIMNAIRWSHIFSPTIFSNLSLTSSFYDSRMGTKTIFQGDKNLKKYASLNDFSTKIDDFNLNYETMFYLQPNYHLRFGAVTSLKLFAPDSFTAKIDPDSQKLPKRNIDWTAVNENTLYIENYWEPVSFIKTNLGFRLIHFYANPGNYVVPEPRIAVSFHLPQEMAIKTSYTWMHQFTHTVTGYVLGLPSDLWVPSTKNFGPQSAHQVTLGYFKDFSKIGLSVSVEGYYKNMNQVLGYKDNLQGDILETYGLVQVESVNDSDWQDRLTQGKSQAYGVEFLIQRSVGKITGWVSYTLGWSKTQFDEVNYGKWFWSDQDRRHNFNVVLNYQITQKWSVSSNFTLSSGLPVTLPIGTTQYFSFLPDANGLNPQIFETQLVFSERNAYRQELYHRLDLGAQYKTPKKYKEGKKNKIKGYHIMDISIYNVYARKNPFAYIPSLNEAQTQIQIERISLYSIIPSIGYTFQFR